MRKPVYVSGFASRRLASRAAWLVGSTVLIATPANAHSEVRPTPETVWTVWEPDPLFAILLLAGVWLYLRGVSGLWRRAGAGTVISRWHVAAFLGGMVAFGTARLTPLDALGGALFSAHMVQHLLVFLVAPTLVAAGRPGLALLWSLPASWRQRVARWPEAPTPIAAAWRGINHWVGVLLLLAGVLWLWHVPALYDAALQSQVVHDLEHAMFAAAALLFWHRVVEAGRPRGIGHAAAFLLIFATALHASALGALLTFADAPLYRSHEPYTSAWGITPLEDQQLAGVIMWVPMGLWFTVVALVIVARWVIAAGESVRRLERAEAPFVPAADTTPLPGRS